MSRCSAIRFIAGTLYGFILWSCSFLVFGHPEPWDDPSGFGELYLFLGNLIGGFVIGYVFGSRHLWGGMGVLFGQVFYLVVCRFSPLMVVGAVFVAGYSIMAFLGEFVGGCIRNKKE